eukprot:EG_transcript_62698
MTVQAEDDGHTSSVRSASTVESNVSELELACTPRHRSLDAPGAGRPKRPSAASASRWQAMDYLKVPGRPTQNSLWSADDPRRVSEAPSLLVPPSEAFLQ